MQTIDWKKYYEEFDKVTKAFVALMEESEE